MKFVGNTVWFLIGGIAFGLLWGTFGIFWCVTIIGIPLGIQCFKFAKLSFAPFGKQFLKIAKLSLMPFGSEITQMD